MIDHSLEGDNSRKVRGVCNESRNSDFDSLVRGVRSHLNGFPGPSVTVPSKTLPHHGSGHQNVLAVIGGGAKAAGIAARAAVGARLGFPMPRILIFERADVGNNWCGSGGFTDGTGLIGTPGDKDLGFPYKSMGPKGHLFAEQLMRHFSWRAYELDQTAGSASNIQQHFDLVDRGATLTPRCPTHAEWARYLKWGISKSGAEVIHARVVGLRWVESKWMLRAHLVGGSEQVFESDGLVVTGPGTPRRPSEIDPSISSRVLDGQDFWLRLAELDGLSRNSTDPVAVIGGGETAGNIVLKLKALGYRVLWLTRDGIPRTRGENVFECRVYSDPDGVAGCWAERSEPNRRELIRVGDRGVVSVGAMTKLSSQLGIDEVAPIDLAQILDGGNGVIVVGSGANGPRYKVWAAVCALGFDPWWFAGMMEVKAQREALAVPLRPSLEREIGRDLALGGAFEGPKLHLPMVAGLAQGPGFPNLSCLGLLAERILTPYIKKTQKLQDASSAGGKVPEWEEVIHGG